MLVALIPGGVRSRALDPELLEERGVCSVALIMSDEENDKGRTEFL